MLRHILNELIEDGNNLGEIAAAVMDLGQPALEERLDDNEEEYHEEPVRNDNYYELIIPNYNMNDFKEHFRMTRDTFQALLNRLQAVANIQDVIPLEKKLLFSIWVLAKQESFKSVGDRFNFAKSTGHKIFLDMMNLLAGQREEYITWPNDMERQRTSRILRDRSGIPGIIGAIDGTHINIKAPPHNANDYYNRNNCHSIILQGICNERFEFIDVFAGAPGRVHDARVFRISPIYNLLNGEEADQYIEEHQHLLGDNAYPLLPWLMKPFRDNRHLNEEKRRYNTRLSSARTIIEQAFGLLKGKWRRLKFLDMTRIDLIPTVIIAARVLHNFILKNRGIEDAEHMEPEEQGPEENME